MDEGGVQREERDRQEYGKETDEKQKERVRQTGECGTSGADKSRHSLRWEDHHGDELN